MELDRAASPFVQTYLGRQNVDLVRDEPYGIIRKLAASAGEPAVLAVELQKQGEAQPGGAALARDQFAFVSQ